MRFAYYLIRRFPVLADLIARDYEPTAVIDGVAMYVRRTAGRGLG